MPTLTIRNLSSGVFARLMLALLIVMLVSCHEPIESKVQPEPLQPLQLELKDGVAQFGLRMGQTAVLDKDFSIELSSIDTGISCEETRFCWQEGAVIRLNFMLSIKGVESVFKIWCDPSAGHYYILGNYRFKVNNDYFTEKIDAKKKVALIYFELREKPLVMPLKLGTTFKMLQEVEYQIGSSGDTLIAKIFDERADCGSVLTEFPALMINLHLKTSDGELDDDFWVGEEGSSKMIGRYEILIEKMDRCSPVSEGWCTIPHAVLTLN